MVSQLMREIRIEGAHSSGQRWHQLYGTFYSNPACCITLTLPFTTKAFRVYVNFCGRWEGL